MLFISSLSKGNITSTATHYQNTFIVFSIILWGGLQSVAVFY